MNSLPSWRSGQMLTTSTSAAAPSVSFGAFSRAAEGVARYIRGRLGAQRVGVDGAAAPTRLRHRQLGHV